MLIARFEQVSQFNDPGTVADNGTNSKTQLFERFYQVATDQIRPTAIQGFCRQRQIQIGFAYHKQHLVPLFGLQAIHTDHQSISFEVGFLQFDLGWLGCPQQSQKVADQIQNMPS